ncbi:hypothetical protein YC2023_104377 [Brassica napus]
MYVINTCPLLRLCSPSSPTSLFFNFSQFAARERDGAAGNGAEKQIIRPGTGPKRAPDQTVTVHCTGFGQGRLGLKSMKQRFQAPENI